MFFRLIGSIAENFSRILSIVFSELNARLCGILQPTSGEKSEGKRSMTQIL